MNAAYEYDGSLSAVMLGFSPQAMQLGICSTAVVHQAGLTWASSVHKCHSPGAQMAVAWWQSAQAGIRLYLCAKLYCSEPPSQGIKEQQSLAEWLAHSTGYLDGLQSLYALVRVLAAV